MNKVIPALALGALLTATAVGSFAQGAEPASPTQPTNVKARDKKGETALMHAAENGDLAAVKSLIAAGADVNAKSKGGGTALMFAAYAGHADIVKALLQAGADVKAEDKHGMRALMFAAQAGKSDCVSALIAAGAGVNDKNKDGETALVKAICMQWNESRSPQPGLTMPGYMLLNPAGSIASNQAATASQVGALANIGGQLLANAIIRPPMVKYATGWGEGGADVVNSLIQAGADTNVKDALDGMTPLTAATAQGKLDLVVSLIAAHADVNAKDRSGRTPLMQAAVSGGTACLNALLAASADVNAKDKHGNTALMLAKYHPDVVAALKAAGETK
jgi:ankyrin repeat protein